MRLKSVLLAAAVVVAMGQAAMGADAAADAEKMFRQETSRPQWKKDYTGEDFAWQTAYGMRSIFNKYLATKDEAYLDGTVKLYDAILARMQTGPDGYKGFIGPFEYNNKYWCDDHVGDAILFDNILDFSLVVMHDSKLKAKYGDKAMSYVNAAKKDFFEKWDSRGTYREDGPYGYYVGWDKYGNKPGQLTDWKVEPECASQSGLSLPFNKQIDCGAVALRIWQITGEGKYKVKAEQLYGMMKSRMQNYNGAYHWNYWEPAGQADLGLTPADMLKGEWNPAEAKTTMRHWTGVHPARNYQSGEIGNIIKAYHAGIIFTEADIKGMIQTNLKVMWNGDEKTPLFANSNADLRGVMGKPESYAGKHAGELWRALAPFDAQINKIAGGKAGAPSFERQETKGKTEMSATYSQFPIGNVRTVQMACVMPSVFALGQTAVIDCKLIEPGELEVAVYAADGKSKVATLKKDKMPGGGDGREGVCYFRFDGTLPDGEKLSPGEYRIRWTVTGDGWREFPITVTKPEN